MGQRWGNLLNYGNGRRRGFEKEREGESDRLPGDKNGGIQLYIQKKKSVL